MTLTSDIVGEAIREYSYRVLNNNDEQTLSPNIRFLYRFSEPDSFDCSSCGDHVGVTLFGEADECASWNDLVVMDGEIDTPIYCVDCYQDLVEELS